MPQNYYKTGNKRDITMNFRRLLEMHKPYLIFAVLRIILTCLPQIGYVHPDEYFQSIEVIAEKAFEVKANPPWEYNTTFPIRSVTPPYLTVGTSYQILKQLNLLLSMQFRTSIITPYFLIVFPRLLMCCVSFLVDWSLYRICSANNEKYKSRCLILSVSYVMMIYATRTFSNTIELVLFSLLLYFVAESIIFSTINVRQREYLNNRYRAAEKPVDRAKFHKLKLFLEDDSLRNCLAIATITVAGFFNRPTFVAYAVAPVFFWLYRGLGFRSVSSLNFHLRIAAFLLSTVPTIIVFILVDSFYFGYLTWGEVGVWQVTIDNFVVTPLNFIRYNINPTNLAQHGLHPQYLHAAVNVPLLFNVLGLIAYCNLIDLCSSLVQAKYHYLPTVRSIRGLMTTSFITPLVMLSAFPHQEPRFLIPLLLPLVYLYGPTIFPETDDVVQAFKASERRNVHKTPETHYLFKIWVATNVLLVLFYGFIHQGGVFPFISHIQGEMKHADHRLSYHVITSHIYSVPQALFLQRASWPERLVLHEEGSASLDEVLKKVLATLKVVDKCRLYLVLPNTLLDALDYHLYKQYGDLAKVDTISFYPHVSTEALPDVLCLNSGDGCESFLVNPASSFVKFLQSFGLARVQLMLRNDRY